MDCATAAGMPMERRISAASAVRMVFPRSSPLANVARRTIPMQSGWARSYGLPAAPGFEITQDRALRPLVPVTGVNQFL